MPVASDRPLAVVSEAKRQIEVLTDKAQQDLLDAISSISIAAESDRRDLLLATAEEFIRSLSGKLKLASKIAASVPNLEYGKDS